MRLWKNLKNGTEKTYELWESIEVMPVYYWVKILETGDLKYLFKEGEGKVTSRVEDKWLELQDEYMAEFGQDEKFKQRLRTMRDIIEYNCDYVLTGDRMLKNYIKMAEADLESITKEKVHSFYEVLDYVEKYKGYHIDPKTITVIKWYHTLRNMAKNGKED